MTTFIDGISGAELRDGVVRLHLYTHHAQAGAGTEGGQSGPGEPVRDAGSLITSVKGALQMLSTLEQFKASLLEADVLRLEPAPTVAVAATDAAATEPERLSMS